MRILGTMLVLAVLWAGSVRGQGMRSVTVRLDNDILALRGRGAPADYDYTQGLVLGVELDSAPRWVPGGLPACDPSGTEACVRTRIEVGQRIYTPRRDAPNPIPGERPYAAWLYAGGGVEGESGRGVRLVEVEIGVMGPPALGEQVQNGVHRLTGSERQEGWAHQTGFEPGILLRFQEGRRWGGGAVRVEPAIRVELGNVRTAAAVGASGVLGRGTGPFVRLGGRREWVVRATSSWTATLSGAARPHASFPSSARARRRRGSGRVSGRPSTASSPARASTARNRRDTRTARSC